MPKKYIYSFITIAAFAFLLNSACAPRGTDDETTAAPNPVAADELIRQGDALYAQRADLAKVRASIALFKRARRADAQNFAAAWKSAQAEYFLGDNAPDEKESAKAFKDGVEAAKIATNLAADKPDGYFWHAANLGGQARQNALSGISSVGEIRELMNKVIAIEPSYQGASAYDALAQVELETKLTGGSAEKAVEYLQKALTIEKSNAYIYLHLAEAYLALDRQPDAKKQIDILLKLAPKPDFVPEYNRAVKDAKKLLETKF